MTSRFDWSGMGLYLVISIVAVGLTAWQVRVDRSVFEPFFAAANPTVMMIGSVVIGAAAVAHLQGISELAVLGPGSWRSALVTIAWAVPLLAAVAIGADVALRFPEDTNVAVPDAFRFYPAIAVFVETAIHAMPIALLVALVGGPSGMNVSFWRIAVPVALLEATLQAAYATSIGTSVFSAVHLVVFGVAQVWMFWRFGFVWMLGFRLAYYALWHIVWGVARLELLF